MAEPSDDELVALVMAGRDKRAFGVLVRRHEVVVRGLLMRLCRNHALAEDLAQDAFVRAYTRIDSYRATGSFKSWLCRIAYTEFLKSARKRKSADRALDRLQNDAVEDSAPPADGGARVDLDRALATLKPDERVCVVLCYAGGLSHSEAAGVTGFALGTVKSHVKRGRDKLKAWFERKVEAA
ncbi:MAG: RNA polymerase sigma factor [Pseudomonadota bacterium]